MEVVTDEVHIRHLIEQARRGETVVIMGLGDSMRPLLKDGRDLIELSYIKEEETLKKYEIVFYKSYSGAYVLHRIFEVTKEGCWMNGDGNFLIEPLVKREDIYMKAVGIWRNGKYINMDQLLYRCYSVLWMKLLPVRGYLFRIYNRLNKSRREY